MEFVDLKEQFRRYQDEMMSEIGSVLESAAFIKGPALDRFEAELARHSGVKHAIGCSSGTDALLLGLMALGVEPGDEVIVPDFTFIATAEVVSFLGAVPVFADIEAATYNIDPSDITSRITDRTKGIIPVSLYGQCADMKAINRIAQDHGLWVMEDAAQSYGATYHGRRSCGLSDVAATSFFPAKPLGCYGDGGAVFTSSDAYAERIRMLLNHGQEKRYHHAIIGMNGRLDGLQAAVLSVKLRHFDEEMTMKRRVAAVYTERLKDAMTVPLVHTHNSSVWAQYTVRTPNRDAVVAGVKERGVPTAIHYPLPLHQQKAFADLPSAGTTYPVAERMAAEVFSLPMHPFLSEEEIDTVCTAVVDAVG